MIGSIPKLKLAVIFILLASILAIRPAHAQQDIKKPTAPLLIFGFEGADAVKGWTSSNCVVSTKQIPDGDQGMSFSFPAYITGQNEYPSAAINWDNGRGYPSKDWSGYEKIAFEVWIDTNGQQDFYLELRDTAGKNGWTRDTVVMPGQKNHVEIDISDIGGIDIHNIQQILFFATRPGQGYTATVDNFRLIPAQKRPLAKFDLVYPNYQQRIFPNARNIQVSVEQHSEEYGIDPKNLLLKLIASSAKRSISSEAKCNASTALITLPTKNLPSGDLQLTASLVNTADGTTLSEQKWTLHKLTKTEVASLKTYIDESNNTIVDGKPFFPLGWYSDPRMELLDEIADSPFNCILDYGTNNTSKTYMLNYLDKMHQKGLKLIYCLNDVYPTATYFKDRAWEGVTGNEQIVSAVVDAYKNHPAVIAWYLNDELPKTLKPKLEEYYHKVASEDPTRPCLIVLCNMSELKHFPDTTDIMGVDLYPVPTQPITDISLETDMAYAAVNGHKPIWVVPQAFAWYQYGPNPDRGHTPNEQELREGRAPTFEEDRCMTYLALTHGAKGLIYYCYYDMRLLPQYKEMWGWMKRLGAEIKDISPMLLSPDDYGTVQCSPANTGIHTKLKKYKGELYLMAVNVDNAPCKETLNIGKHIAKTANVLFEDRSVKTEGTALTDNFKPLEVHVYNLGKAAK